MAYTLQQHIRYNLWANEKIALFLSKADESIFDTEVSSSFSSLRKTVYHIWDAEVIWLKRLKGESISEWPSKSFAGNREQCLKEFIAHTRQLANFVEACDEAQQQAIITYKNLKGEELHSTVQEIVMHVVNHGTFHRGQLVTMLRGLGFTDLQSTDLITYLRTANS